MVKLAYECCVITEGYGVELCANAVNGRIGGIVGCGR